MKIAELLLTCVLSFLLSIVLTKFAISFLKSIDLTGVDIMKHDFSQVPESGFSAVIAFIFSILFGIAINLNTFNSINITHLLASIVTILLTAIIGFIDTLTSLLKKHEGTTGFEKYKRIGLPKIFYFLLPLPAAIPLVAVNVGITTMGFPYFGRINVGKLYPFILVPLAVLFCSNATNMLAGFNGLETGMGFVLHLTLAIFAYINHRTIAVYLSLTFAMSLLGFLLYNWYPAKIFPGELNYVIGSVAACSAIIGNIEKFAMIVFIPWIIEAIIKACNNFEGENFGTLREDGTLDAPEDLRSLTHLVMRLGDFREWEISLIFILLETFICIDLLLEKPVFTASSIGLLFLIWAYSRLS